MRIAFVTIGTHGDVLPVITLARAMHDAGHTVRVASTETFRQAVEPFGMEFYLLRGDSVSLFGSRLGVTLREMTAKPAGFRKFWDTFVAGYARQHLHDTWEACDGFDTAVCTPWFHAAPNLAEKLGKPCFATTPMPPVGLPTREFPNYFDAHTHASSCASSSENLRTWRSGTLMLDAIYEQVNDWRVKDLGLPRQSRLQAIRSYRRCPFLLNYSPKLLPKPADWPEKVSVAGFWGSNGQPQWEPSPELNEFLSKFPSPILVGFSSQVASRPREFTETIVQAIEATGHPAILLTNWGGLQKLDHIPPIMLQQDFLPHEWIAPRLAAFLHHAGCGSTAICLRFGIPQVTIPFGFDQMLWSRRVHEMGLGPPPLQLETLNAGELAAALRIAIDEPQIRRQARAVAAEFATEDGVADTVAFIERTIAEGNICAA